MSIDEQQQLHDQQIIFALEQQHGSKDKALIALNNHSARSMQTITDLKELLREAKALLDEYADGIEPPPFGAFPFWERVDKFLADRRLKVLDD